MSLKDNLLSLSEKIPQMKEKISSEEATKNSLVLPFISALGYNIFDPTEVIPEFTADVGSKKGEKVDYVISINDQPVFLFECKWCGTNLNEVNASQLRRYFHVTDARIGILTNGITYQFFSDIDESNKMDEKFFMELNLENIDETLIPEVEKLSKAGFELESMLSTANDLKYSRQIKNLIASEFSNPSPDFVKYFTSQVYHKKIMPSVLEQFTPLTKKALHMFLNSKIDERLKSALTREEAPEEDKEGSEDETANQIDVKDGVVTTDEEIEGFHIVRAIVAKKIDPERITQRDTKSYFGVLIDDNNRKPVCRLHFNSRQKYLGLFDSDKNETKVPIDKLTDIYKYSKELNEKAESYV